MDRVIEEFRRERDKRDRVQRETTSWHLKVFLPCLIVIAAVDLADILGYVRIRGMGTGTGIGLLVFAVVTLFVFKFGKNR